MHTGAGYKHDRTVYRHYTIGLQNNKIGKYCKKNNIARTVYIQICIGIDLFDTSIFF